MICQRTCSTPPTLPRANIATFTRSSLNRRRIMTVLSRRAVLGLLAVPLLVRVGERDARAVSPSNILVFTRTAGYRHDSIPDGLAALQSIGTELGVGVESSEEPGAFEDANLSRFGAIVLLSTTGDFLGAE